MTPNVATPKKYRVHWTAEVELTITDPDVIARTQTADWQGQFYRMDENAAIEMVARMCGLFNRDIDRVDGWADLPNADGVQINDVSYLDAEVEAL